MIYVDHLWIFISGIVRVSHNLSCQVLIGDQELTESITALQQTIEQTSFCIYQVSEDELLMVIRHSQTGTDTSVFTNH